MKQVLIIKGELPSLNEHDNMNRRVVRYDHKTLFSRGAQLKKEYTDLIAWECKAQNIKPYKKPIYLEFSWVCKDKRKDKDNISFAKKYILDGMQKAGAIKRDGWNNIIGWTETFTVDKNMPMVIVKIDDKRPLKK